MPINYPGSDSWVANVREYATTDPATGGTGGAANLPIEDLANRTQYLKAEDMRKFKQAVETISGGRMTIMTDALGEWHLMVQIPAFNPEEIDPDLGPGPDLDGVTYHPAFSRISDTSGESGAKNCRLWVAAVPVRILQVSPARYGSQPAGNPADFLGNALMTLANARAYAATLGDGWHVLNAVEWGALGLLSRGRTLRQRGNINSGTSELGVETAKPYAHERGVACHEDIGQSMYCLPGSGPPSWRHDGTPFGVADLVGNYEEWVDGVYSDSGKIHLMEMNWPYADTGECVIDEADLTDTGLYWGKDGSNELRVQATGTIDNTQYSKEFAGLEISGVVGSEDIFSTPILLHTLMGHWWTSGGSGVTSDMLISASGVNAHDFPIDLITALTTYLSPTGLTVAGMPGRVTEKLEAAKHYYVRGGDYACGDDAGFGRLTFKTISETAAFRLAYIENID